MKRFVAVAGTIGAGKTSLVNWLVRRYGLVPFYEPNDHNPYLADFYADMSRWAFHSQCFFLSHKMALHQQMERSPKPAVLDRTIYEDAEIFARNLYEQGHMTERDYQVYSHLYGCIRATLRPPDVLRPMPTPARLDFAALEARLRAANPWLQADEARIRTAESNRDLTYRNRYPDLSLGVSPIQTRNRVNEWEVMLELNIPLQQESRRSQEREAERMLDAARMRREASLNQALSDLGESLAGLEAARRLEQLTETQMLPQAELGFRAALAAFENGRVDFATLLDAQRQIRKARQDLVKARAEQRIRLAEIERLVGEDL